MILNNLKNTILDKFEIQEFEETLVFYKEYITFNKADLKINQIDYTSFDESINALKKIVKIQNLDFYINGNLLNEMDIINNPRSSFKEFEESYLTDIEDDVPRQLTFPKCVQT